MRVRVSAAVAPPSSRPRISSPRTATRPYGPAGGDAGRSTPRSCCSHWRPRRWSGFGGGRRTGADCRASWARWSPRGCSRTGLPAQRRWTSAPGRSRRRRDRVPRRVPPRGPTTGVTGRPSRRPAPRPHRASLRRVRRRGPMSRRGRRQPGGSARGRWIRRPEMRHRAVRVMSRRGSSSGAAPAQAPEGGEARRGQTSENVSPSAEPEPVDDGSLLDEALAKLEESPPGRSGVDQGEACDDGDKKACMAVARLHAERGASEEARLAYRQACRLGLAEGCMKAARLFEREAGVEAEVQALLMFKSACTLRSGRGCFRAAVFSEERRGGGIASDAPSYLRRACALGHKKACPRDRSEAPASDRTATSSITDT